MKYATKFSKYPIFVLGLLMLAGCNKYDEGPFMSLKSPDSRVEGTWIITKATEYEGTDTRDETSNYNDDSFTFSEDGTATHAFNDGTTNVTSNGTWVLLNEGETLRLTESWTFLGTTYTNSDDWAIKQLTNKSMIIENTKNDVRTRLEMSGE